MKNNLILVTGVAGYIGGTFAYEALKKGYQVIGIDNYINSSKKNVDILSVFDEFEFINIDLSKKSLDLSQIIKKFKISSIVHFAGLKAVGESEVNQLLYWENNVLSTLNILEEIKNKDINFIFSSSATVYGDCEDSAIAESHKLSTSSAYGSTKLAQELLISDYARAWGIRCISLRYFNPVASHSDLKIVEDYHNSPNNLMPRVLRVAKGIEKKIYIFGDDYDTEDGTGERDYIHIEDLVAGHFAALEKITEMKGNNVFNLGTGKKTSVLELIKVFKEVNGIEIDFEFTDRRPGDVQTCFASPELANKILEWKSVKNIQEMCKDAWEAIKNES